MVQRHTFRLASGLALLVACLSVGAGLTTALPAQAQGAATAKSAIEIDLTAFKVVRDDSGKETFVDAKRARPGDILEYRAVYANTSSKGVKNLQANLPIPEETSLIVDSVSPKPAMGSADGKSFGSLPLMHSVKLPNGTTEMRPIPSAAYRMLRWPVGSLAAGDSVTMRARVRLNTATPVTH